MKLAAFVLIFAISGTAYANCRDRAIEIDLDTSTAAPFDLQTVVRDRCIRAETLVILHAVNPIGQTWRYWQTFPNQVHGEAVINHPPIAPGFERFLATFKTADLD